MRTLIFAILPLLPLSASAYADISQNDCKHALTELDDSLARRNIFIERRQNIINRLVDSLNSLPSTLDPRPLTPDREDLLLRIAQHYIGFNNDSALQYISRGYEESTSERKILFALAQAQLLPLSGFFSPALDIYNSINPDSLSPQSLIAYYENGRQMYSYMAAFAGDQPQYITRYSQAALQCQQNLLHLLDPNSLEYKFNLGEYYFLTGQKGKATALLDFVYHNTPINSPLRAKAAHHLSSIAKDNNHQNAHIFFLAQSALADVCAATREVASLQELGYTLYIRNDVDRAYNYLTDALARAVQCGAPLRMIQSSRSLPIIEHAKTQQLNAKRTTIYIILAILIAVVLALLTVLFILRREMKHLRILQDNLRKTNRIKDLYISRFLDLCSIYMDKLNQFCKIANRKISAGKVDDLYRLTKSGKFVEQQSKDFYDVFDNAFLHLYPNFLQQVNSLLRPDAQISLKDGELLNTDLRILAFLRLGIQETTRIAQVLNYSVNTIYTYRHRTKAAAINPDSFEADILNIQSL